MLTAEAQLKIDNWFRYHPPQGDQAERYEAIRDNAGKALAAAMLDQETESIDEELNDMEQAIYRCCPDSIERDYALEQLSTICDAFYQEGADAAICVLRFGVIMPANAAIACNE